MAGAGTHLHQIIRRRFGEDLTEGCDCQKWIDRMNRHGTAWCRRKIRVLTEHLRAEAVDRGWRLATRTPGHRLALRGIVLLAIRRAEHDR